MLPRCRFPAAGTAVDCAFSGGADSTALVILARAAGCQVTAHHVDHGIRPSSPAEAAQAGEITSALGVGFRLHRVNVAPGPNLEARARAARWACLPPAAMTGHTADDQAETLLLRLVRGAGADGLAAMDPDVRHPILSLRRHETEALCRAEGVEWVEDPSNQAPDHRRNRIRAEVIPLLAEIAQRDVTPLLTRTADLLRDDAAFLDGLAAQIDPTDARAVAAAPVVLARRALRLWLTEAGYPPDAATIERVLEVARGTHVGCEIGGGRRVDRQRQLLRITPPTR